eukprot:5666161-Prymnesium_polylepis.1
MRRRLLTSRAHGTRPATSAEAGVRHVSRASYGIACLVWQVCGTFKSVYYEYKTTSETEVPKNPNMARSNLIWHDPT